MINGLELDYNRASNSRLLPVTFHAFVSISDSCFHRKDIHRFFFVEIEEIINRLYSKTSNKRNLILTQSKNLIYIVMDQKLFFQFFVFFSFPVVPLQTVIEVKTRVKFSLVFGAFQHG